jgi:hypothetical protein
MSNSYLNNIDALPGIGHACGHNLIAMMSIGAFIGVAKALEQQKIPGRVRLIGTPAEEGFGGKIPIIEAGAYTDVDACMMVHPGPFTECPGFTGDAYMPTLASLKFSVRFTGKTAHAAMAPWEGVNALDAAVLSYNSIGVLRQQIHPCNRVHCIISDGGLRPNIIPGSSALDCYVRSPTLAMAEELFVRVKNCFEGAALQAGCTLEIQRFVSLFGFLPGTPVADMISDTIHTLICDPTRPWRQHMQKRCPIWESRCGAISTHLESRGQRTKVSPEFCHTLSFLANPLFFAGNVTYECPGIQAYVGVHAAPGANNHTPGFTAVAGTKESHDLCIHAAKGMAIAGMSVLQRDNLAEQVRLEFEDDKNRRSLPSTTKMFDRNAGFC